MNEKVALAQGSCSKIWTFVAFKDVSLYWSEIMREGIESHKDRTSDCVPVVSAGVCVCV